MAGESKTTTNHDTIKQWAEERGGVPATVKDTAGKNDPAGLLRIHFPDYSDDPDLKEISWDTFFEKFDEKNLKFLYQEKTDSGDTSRFFKFIEQ